MTGPKKKSKKPSENESDNDSLSEGSVSGSYHGQQVSISNSCLFKKLFSYFSSGN